VTGKVAALLELGAGFNMEYTGMKNIYLNAAMMRVSQEEIEKRIPDILAFADIGDYINQPVRPIPAVCLSVWLLPWPSMWIRIFSLWTRLWPWAMPASR
jgi:hypothetical protein